MNEFDGQMAVTLLRNIVKDRIAAAEDADDILNWSAYLQGIDDALKAMKGEPLCELFWKELRRR